eukprot:scaffold2026_cov176-Amphora_coffeaeformis.AAC.1
MKFQIHALCLLSLTVRSSGFSSYLDSISTPTNPSPADDGERTQNFGVSSSSSSSKSNNNNSWQQPNNDKTLNPWGFPVTPPKKDKNISSSNSVASSSGFNTNPWAAASLPTQPKTLTSVSKKIDSASNSSTLKPKSRSASTTWGAYGGRGVNAASDVERKIDAEIENIAYFLENVDSKRSSSSQNPLDAIVNMQIEMMKGEGEVMRKLIAESMKEKTNTYGYLLKKHFRLALTGGVSVKKKLPVERPIPKLKTKGMTERIMNRMYTRDQATGSGGSSTWATFLKAEENWARLREYIPGKNERVPKPFVIQNDISQDSRSPRSFEKLNRQKETSLDYDVAVCGGTLGIFYAIAMQLRGLRVCVVEAGSMRGREQEWNISMDDLMKLVELGVVSEADLDASILTEFPG